MIPKTASHRGIAVACFLACLFLLGQSTPAGAGCGCDKPPPAPAAVIPSIAFAGLPVTLFHDSFQVGQRWDVVFQSGSTTATVTASVVLRRDLTDPTGETYTPQLVVTVPSSIPVGPTSILAYTENDSLVVPEESFTVIAKPVVISEQAADHKVKDYTTAVGYGGTLYISVGGLDDVCKAMEFEGYMKDYPLRFAEDGDIVIFNSQGFFIDSLSTESADYFFIEPQEKKDSNLLHYFRHSFETYCTDHQPGGAKEVDPEDPNWHLDGTPHVDYSTLIFAIAGHFDDGSVPEAGRVSFKELKVETEISDDEQEVDEEKVKGSQGGKKGDD